MNSKELRNWRQEHRLTQEKLAQMLGVIRVTVARWEAEARGIPPFLHLALEALEHRLSKRENLGPKKDSFF